MIKIRIPYMRMITTQEFCAYLFNRFNLSIGKIGRILNLQPLTVKNYIYKGKKTYKNNIEYYDSLIEIIESV